MNVRMTHNEWPRIAAARPTIIVGALACTLGIGLAGAGQPETGPAAPVENAQAPTSLEETRLAMGKWIETQQIIARDAHRSAKELTDIIINDIDEFRDGEEQPDDLTLLVTKAI